MQIIADEPPSFYANLRTPFPRKVERICLESTREAALRIATRRRRTWPTTCGPFFGPSRLSWESRGAIAAEPFSLEKTKGQRRVVLNYAAIDDYPLHDGQARLGCRRLHRNLEVRMGAAFPAKKVHIARLPEECDNRRRSRPNCYSRFNQAKAMISVVLTPLHQLRGLPTGSGTISGTGAEQTGGPLH